MTKIAYTTWIYSQTIEDIINELCRSGNYRRVCHNTLSLHLEQREWEENLIYGDFGPPSPWHGIDRTEFEKARRWQIEAMGTIKNGIVESFDIPTTPER